MIIRIALFFLFLLAASVQADFKYYEEPDPRPYLVDIGPFPPCDYIIDTPAKWSNINSSAYRVFCVAPGDYSSVGLINVKTSGTPTAKKWLRYYNPNVPDSKHPYHMTTAERARIDKIRLQNADHWIFDRLFIHNVKRFDTDFSFWLIRSDQNVINRVYIYQPTRGLRFDDGSSYNTAQHNVVHEMAHGSDSVGFHINGRNYDGYHPIAQPKFNRVISNECIDLNDCVHFAGNGPTEPSYILAGEEDYEGTVVYNNEGYLTSKAYTDCNGNYVPTGDCACKEDFLDVKSGTENAANPLLVAHNRMWGYKTTDPTCPTSSGPPLTAVNAVIQNNVKNLRFEGNISWGGGHVTFSYGLENVLIKNNLFYAPNVSNITGYWVQSLSVAPSTIKNVEISGNVFSAINARPSLRPFGFGDTAQKSTQVKLNDNVLVNSNAPSAKEFAGTVSGNRYYKTLKPSWDTSPAANMPTVVGSGWEGTFCTKIKRITGPETKCFPNALNAIGGPAPIESPSALQVLQ